MTAEEGSYTMNKVKELIQNGIQNRIAAWWNLVQDDNTDLNLPPPPLQESPSANILSDLDLAKLANLLKPS